MPQQGAPRTSSSEREAVCVTCGWRLRCPEATIMKHVQAHRAQQAKDGRPHNVELK